MSLYTIQLHQRRREIWYVIKRQPGGQIAGVGSAPDQAAALEQAERRRLELEEEQRRLDEWWR